MQFMFGRLVVGVRSFEEIAEREGKVERRLRRVVGHAALYCNLLSMKQLAPRPHGTALS
jgi:hypothetical protein